jgi:hypothetical protein
MPLHVGGVCFQLVSHMAQPLSEMRFQLSQAPQLDRGQSIECCCVA